MLWIHRFHIILFLIVKDMCFSENKACILIVEFSKYCFFIHYKTIQSLDHYNSLETHSDCLTELTSRLGLLMKMKKYTKFLQNLSDPLKNHNPTHRSLYFFSVCNFIMQVLEEIGKSFFLWKKKYTATIYFLIEGVLGSKS